MSGGVRGGPRNPARLLDSHLLLLALLLVLLILGLSRRRQTGVAVSD